MSLNLPNENPSYIYEGDDPSRYEAVSAQVTNRAVKQVNANVKAVRDVVQSGINNDGTVKSSKVITSSVAAKAIDASKLDDDTRNKIDQAYNSANSVAQDTEPNSPVEGFRWFDTKNKEVKIYISGNWIKLTSVEDIAMTEAEFNAVAGTRREQYAGNGYIHHSAGWWNNINGIGTLHHNEAQQLSYGVNTFYIGSENKRLNPYPFTVNVNGVKQRISFTNVDNSGICNKLVLPENHNIPVESNITALSHDYKQGDNFILSDTTTNLMPKPTNVTNAEGAATIKDNGDGTYTYNRHNEDGSHAWFLYYNKDMDNQLISNNIYTLEFDLDYTESYNVYTSGKISEEKTEGHYKATFKYIRGSMYFNDVDKNTDIKLSNITIKQTNSTAKIVCLSNFAKETDLSTNSTLLRIVDTFSRRDLVFLESWHELIADKGIVYPFGNVQYRGNNANGLSSIADGTFTGADTYSNFGNWQEPGALVGKGYVWDNLTNEQKKIFISDPEHNIYSSKDGLVQVRYHIKVVKGLNSNFFSGNLVSYGTVFSVGVGGCYDTVIKNESNEIIDFSIDQNISYVVVEQPDGSMFTSSQCGYTNSTFRGLYLNKDYEKPQVGAKILVFKDDMNMQTSYKSNVVPIALVQRRNNGIYHDTFNPEGCARVYVDGKAVISQLAPASTITKLEDCFNRDLIAAVNKNDSSDATKLSSVDNGDSNPNTYKTTGTIESRVSGRPDGLYTDEVNERDIEDLRMSAHKVTDKKGYLEEQFNKAVAGEIRGKENRLGSIWEYYWLSTSATVNNKNGGIFPYQFGSITRNYIVRNHTIYLNSKASDSYKYRRMLVQWLDSNLDSLGYEIIYETTFADQIRTVKPTGTVAMKILSYSKIKVPQNNTALICDIIGDPRTIEERVTITTVTGDDQTAVVGKGTYVHADTHYYLSLVDRGVDAITIDPDTEDYTNTTNWKDFGTDGTVGGYPTLWKEQGLLGTPFLFDENGESILPMDMPYAGDNHSKVFKASRKLSSLKKVIATKKDGSSVELVNGNPDNTSSTFIVHSYNGNTCRFNVIDTYSDLGYDSAEDMLANVIIQCFYETSANNTELTNNMEVVSDINRFGIFNRCDHQGHKLVANLLNKIPIELLASYNNLTESLTVASAAGKYSNMNKWKDSSYPTLPSHDTPKTTGKGVTAKFFPYLTKSNSRAQMNLVFKELKWDYDLDSRADATEIDGTTAQPYTSGKLYIVTGMDSDVIVQSKVSASIQFNELTLREDKWYTDNQILYAVNFDGNGWGDDNQFQITDGVSIMQDDNDQTVLYGQKSIKLPNFLD